MTTKEKLLPPLMLMVGMLMAFTFSSPGNDGWSSGETVTSTHMNDIDTGLDNLEAGTSIAASLTRDAEWDTVAEIETATSVNIIVSTEIDTITELNALTTDNDIQPLDSDLTAIAALTTTATGLSILDDASTSAMRTTLGLAIGTNVQAWDSDLDDLADGTLTVAHGGTGAATFTATAVLKGNGTSAVASSGVLIDASDNIVVPGNATIGTSGATTMILRNTANSGYVECGCVTTTWTCGVDADGIADGTP